MSDIFVYLWRMHFEQSFKRDLRQSSLHKWYICSKSSAPTSVDEPDTVDSSLIKMTCIIMCCLGDILPLLLFQPGLRVLFFFWSDPGQRVDLVYLSIG